ncbi:MAG TPA: zinc-binding dehydrogenase [Thermoleophilaceae bacterium]
MRALTIQDGELVVEERPDPEPGKGELLVRVRGAGLNGADMLQRKGAYPAPAGSPADIPGLELAGEVEALGPGAERFAEGDRVMAVVGGGGQAELAVVHERAAMPVPRVGATASEGGEPLDWPAAGGLPEVFTTAHDALFTQAGLRPGDHLLVHGAAGGVGCAAVQLGRAAGARVTATVRNEELRGRVTELGARAIDPEGYEEEGPFDVILELVGASNLQGNIRSLATGGRIAVIGVGGTGPTGEISLHILMQKRGRIHGSTLRARPLEEKAIAMRLVEKEVLPHFSNGTLTVPVAETFELDRAEEAYTRFEAGGKLGKIVLLP